MASGGLPELAVAERSEARPPERDLPTTHFSQDVLVGLDHHRQIPEPSPQHLDAGVAISPPSEETSEARDVPDRRLEVGGRRRGMRRAALTRGMVIKERIWVRF